MTDQLSQQDHDKVDLLKMYLSTINNLIQEDDYPAALIQIERVLQLDPNNSQALELKKRVDANTQLGASASSGQQLDEKELLKSRKQEKLQQIEEQRRKMDQMRREFEELQRMEEQLRKREEEQLRLEEQRRREMELKRKQEEERKRKEEERRRQEELKRKQEQEERQKKIRELQAQLEQLKTEEQQLHQQDATTQEDTAADKAVELTKQEEVRMKREEEQLRREEDDRKRREELRRKEEESLRTRLEEKKREEEQRAREEEERRRIEELRRKEEEEKRKLEEQRNAEDERKRQEQLKRREQEQLQQAEHMRKVQENLKVKEEELRRQEMERVIQHDPAKRLEYEMRLSREKTRRIETQISTAEELFSKGDFDGALIEISKVLEDDQHHVKALTLRQKARVAKEQQKKLQLALHEAQKSDAPENLEREFRLTDDAGPQKKSLRTFLIVALSVIGIIGAVIAFTQLNQEPQNKIQSATTSPTSPPHTTTTQQQAQQLPPSTSTTAPAAQPTQKPPPPKVSVEDRVSKAHQLTQKKNYMAAIGEYASAIEIAPNRSDLYASQAMLHIMVGKYNDAVQVLTWALKINPADTALLQSLAFAHQLNGTLKDGFRYHETLLGLVKDSTKYIVGPMADAVLYDQTFLRQNEGRMRAAFDRWTKSHPSDFVTSYRYARLLQELGNKQEANAVLQKVRDYLVEFVMHSNDVKPMTYLALTLSRLNQFTEAEGFIQDAKDQSKTHPEVLYEIARMYAIQLYDPKTKALNTKAKEKALEALREAVTARFLLNELVDADFNNLRGSSEFTNAIHLPLK